MNRFKFFALAAVAAICFMATTPQTEAQVAVNIGVAPECPYGYYDALHHAGCLRFTAMICAACA
jgi:hypothetical protein